MEDLTRKGFTMKDSKLMDYLHVSLAIKRLGVFHAYSFILRIADPMSFEKMKDLEDPMFERKYRNNPNILVKKETVDIVAKVIRNSLFNHLIIPEYIYNQSIQRVYNFLYHFMYSF